MRDMLTAMKDSGRIEIGLSYHVVFELLQEGDTQVPGRSSCSGKAPHAALWAECIPVSERFGRGTRFLKRWPMGSAD